MYYVCDVVHGEIGPNNLAIDAIHMACTCLPSYIVKCCRDGSFQSGQEAERKLQQLAVAAKPFAAKTVPHSFKSMLGLNAYHTTTTTAKQQLTTPTTNKKKYYGGLLRDRHIHVCSQQKSSAIDTPSFSLILLLRILHYRAQHLPRKTCYLLHVYPLPTTGCL